MTTTTTTTALRAIERSDKGMTTNALASALHLTFGEADALVAELLESGAAVRLSNGRLGRGIAR